MAFTDNPVTLSPGPYRSVISVDILRKFRRNLRTHERATAFRGVPVNGVSSTCFDYSKRLLNIDIDRGNLKYSEIRSAYSDRDSNPRQILRSFFSSTNSTRLIGDRDSTSVTSAVASVVRFKINRFSQRAYNSRAISDRKTQRTFCD